MIPQAKATPNASTTQQQKTVAMMSLSTNRWEALGSIAEHLAIATATAHMSTITKPKRITQPRHPKTKESPTEEKESQARQHTQENQKTATEATQEVLESTQKLQLNLPNYHQKNGRDNMTYGCMQPCNWHLAMIQCWIYWIDLYKEGKQGVFEDAFDITPWWEHVFAMTYKSKLHRQKSSQIISPGFLQMVFEDERGRCPVAIYPWAEEVRKEEDLIIENPTDIPTALLLLKTFVHKLFLKTTRRAYHVQVLLGICVNLLFE